MAIVNNFPVFKADQVLTNNHLNDLFNYLDQQDRLTRSKLIGNGIVCGLEISYSQQGIHISKGSALTSQGYILLHCENDYSHYMPYTTPSFPEDLLMISQCRDVETGNIPFYKPAFENNPQQPNFLKLITADAFSKLDEDEKQTATALSAVTKDSLDRFIVVLFLETEELNLKNCDTNDCNDKGSKMDFDVKVLLVDKTEIDKIKEQQQDGQNSNNVTLPEYLILNRYAVLNNSTTNIKSSQGVLNTFLKLVDDPFLTRLSDAFNGCYINYKYLLEGETQNPFTDLFNTLRKLRDDIIAFEPILIQYFYDFISDLVKAYHEFRESISDINTECCGNEMKFPFHIMLGEASINTTIHSQSAYRQYFTYSPLFDLNKEQLNATRLLFARMKLLIEQFSWRDLINFERREVRITPSCLGKFPLSETSIPYYYKPTVAGKELYRFWSPEKTRKGRSKFNLSYNADTYATADPVINPLLYDIENYNFFRVEGHIGKNVNDALTDLQQLRHDYNIPADFIAMSADSIGALIKGEEPKCIIQDLESDYRVLIAEFVCRVHDALCMASKLKYTARPTFLPANFVLSMNTFSAFAGRFAETAPAATAAAPAAGAATGAATDSGTKTVLDDDEDEDKLVFNAINKLPEAADHIYVSSIVNEFHAVKKYQKGDTLARLCNPGRGLLGNTYISIVKSNKGVFKNPVAFRGLIRISPLFYEAFEFIDRVESLFKILMTNELADLNINEFKIAFNQLQEEVKNLQRASQRIAAEVQMTFDSCIVERLEALKNEYLIRVRKFDLLKYFANYFNDHTGAEHKEGVPKGGTMILVYHEVPVKKTIDIRSTFINKELSTLMMSRFQTLLKPAVKLNHLEFQANLIKTAVLYKDPQLYMRFKDVMQKYLDECNDLPPERRKEINKMLVAAPEKKSFELKNGMVIADFYVPYLCCSNCPPIAYILPAPPKDDTADPTISIDKKTFCSDIKTGFPITAAPTGGEVTGPGVSKDGNGNFIFIPNVAGAGTFDLTYTLNGKIATQQVTVVASPIAKFTPSIQEAEVGQELIFDASSSLNIIAGVTVFKWNIMGNSVPVQTTDQVKMIYKVQPNDQNLSIVLTVSNGECMSSTEGLRIRIKDRVEPQRIEKLFCFKEKIDIQPDLEQGAVIKILDPGGLNIERNRIITFADPLKQTKTFTVIYTITTAAGTTQFEAKVTIIVADVSFNISFMLVAPVSRKPAFILKTLDPDIFKVQWVLKVNNVDKFRSANNPAELSQGLTDFETATLHVSVMERKNKCTAEFDLPINRQLLQRIKAAPMNFPIP